MAEIDSKAFDYMNAGDPDKYITGGAMEYSEYEMDMTPKQQKKFLKNNPGKTEQDFIDEAIIRIPMESGGKILDFAKYAKSKDPKIKKLSLAELFTPGKTLAELTPQERETVNTLLKLTFGKKD